MQLRTNFVVMLGLILLIGLAACASPFAQQGGDMVSTVLSDTHVDPVPVNKEVVITTNHQAPSGIREVKFFVNGVLINTQKPPFPDVQFIVENRWMPPEVGEYTARIVAYSSDGKSSEVRLTIVAQSGIIPVATRIIAEETRTAPTAAPLQTAIACLNNASLVTDVTIPDGTELDPGAVFNKTWRVRNSGTCNWGAGYTFAHVSGPTLGGTRVNLAPLPAGGEVDITIPMAAPTGGGRHGSDWRLFDPNGQAFGPVFRVEIVVPQTCEAPTITTFEATPEQIAAGQNSTLSWQVVGAETLTLNPGPRLSGESGSVVVTPSNTTTYILRAQSGDCVASEQVTVTVQQTTDRPAAPENLRVKEINQTTLILIWDDKSDNETEFRLFNAGTDKHLFTYSENATEGEVTGLTCNTTYRWRLHAVNNHGLSEASNITAATTNACN